MQHIYNFDMDKRNAFAFATLEKVLGDGFAIKRKNTSNLPFAYSKNFDLYDIRGPFSIAFIVPRSDDVPIFLIKGVYAKCQSDYGQNVVVFLRDCSSRNKRIFIDARMNFVSSDFDHGFFESDKILDLPEFRDATPKGSYTKATQLIIQFYLNSEIKEYSVREVAENFNLSFSSVSRANAFLHEIGAIEKQGVGNSAKYMLRSKKELLEKAKPFFINPIKRRRMVLLDKASLEELPGYLSGENALAQYSNLEADEGFVEIALEKDQYAKLETMPNKGNGTIVCYLEDFLYDPCYYSRGQTISMFDVFIIALKRYVGNSDPRISGALKELERRLIVGRQSH